MSTIEKRLKKFYRKPIPNDITFDDVRILASYFGCEIVTGGNHSQKVVHKSSGTVIPIPMHGNCIGEAYVTKDVTDDEILDAVRYILEDGKDE